MIAVLVGGPMAGAKVDLNSFHPEAPFHFSIACDGRWHRYRLTNKSELARYEPKG